MSTFTVRADLGACKAPPFARLPHSIAADPRLTPVDVRVVAALLFWARGKAACWPCDRSIGSRVGRSVQTIQRALKRLQALGLIEREKVEPSDDNRTGRIIRLRWRADPRSSASDAPHSSASDEGRNERERERPIGSAGREGPPPSAGDGEEDAPPSAEEVAEFLAWAEGPDPAKARLGRAALKRAGVEAPSTLMHSSRPMARPDEPEVEAPSTLAASPLPSPGRVGTPSVGAEVPTACGTGVPECPGTAVPKVRSPEGGRHLGPEVPIAPSTSAPGVSGPEVPRDQSPSAPKAPGTLVPDARGTSDRQYQSPQAPRHPRDSVPRYLGTLALRLSGALVREFPRS